MKDDSLVGPVLGIFMGLSFIYMLSLHAAEDKDATKLDRRINTTLGVLLYIAVGVFFIYLCVNKATLR
ncbi:MAG: hypothetical protein J6W52_03040 [Bacteroidaceae bacterium]|nr:hypothetical protein [Bacteroidaceae bacterium]